MGALTYPETFPDLPAYQYPDDGDGKVQREGLKVVRRRPRGPGERAFTEKRDPQRSMMIQGWRWRRSSTALCYCYSGQCTCFPALIGGRSGNQGVVPRPAVCL